MCLGTQNFNCTKQGFSIMSQLHICVKSSFPRSCIKSYSKLWLNIFTLKRLQGLHQILNTRVHLGLIKTIWTQWGSSMSSNIGRGDARRIPNCKSHGRYKVKLHKRATAALLTLLQYGDSETHCPHTTSAILQTGLLSTLSLSPPSGLMVTPKWLDQWSLVSCLLSAVWTILRPG